jgi:hypothetical protein
MRPCHQSGLLIRPEFHSPPLTNIELGAVTNDVIVKGNAATPQLRGQVSINKRRRAECAHPSVPLHAELVFQQGGTSSSQNERASVEIQERVGHGRLIAHEAQQFRESAALLGA